MSDEVNLACSVNFKRKWWGVLVEIGLNDCPVTLPQRKKAARKVKKEMRRWTRGMYKTRLAIVRIVNWGRVIPMEVYQGALENRRLDEFDNGVGCQACGESCEGGTCDR